MHRDNARKFNRCLAINMVKKIILCKISECEIINKSKFINTVVIQLIVVNISTE